MRSQAAGVCVCTRKAHVCTWTSHGLHQHTLKRIKSGHALPTASGSSQLICSLLIHSQPSKLSVQHPEALPLPGSHSPTGTDRQTARQSSSSQPVGRDNPWELSGPFSGHIRH